MEALTKIFVKGWRERRWGLGAGGGPRPFTIAPAEAVLTFAPLRGKSQDSRRFRAGGEPARASRCRGLTSGVALPRLDNQQRKCDLTVREDVPNDRVGRARR